MIVIVRLLVKDLWIEVIFVSVLDRERMLHQRNQLKERRADQRRKVDELDQRFERLQLSTFPVFSWKTSTSSES